MVRLAAGSVAKWGYSIIYSATQVSTAARPTKLWKAATSWGKSLIWILLAMAKPKEKDSEGINNVQCP